MAKLNANGNSTYLHGLVDNLTKKNKVQVNTALLAASPYLSVDILTKIGNKSNSLFPNSWYRKLVMKNIEIAHDNDFMNFLLTKKKPLSKGQYAKIAAARSTKHTQRGRKVSNVVKLDSRRTVLLDFLLSNTMSDENEIDWTRYNKLLTKRADIIEGSQHMESYLGTNETKLSTQQLATITKGMYGYQDPITNKEMQDYVVFKNFITSITNKDGSITKINDKVVRLKLESFAIKLTGRAQAQAQNMLCFHFNNCTGIELQLDHKIKARMRAETTNTPADPAKAVTATELQILPNPNSGSFQLSLSQDKEIIGVEIYNALGMKVDVVQKEINSNSVEVTLFKAGVGMYFGIVRCADGTVLKTQFIVQ